LIGLIYDTETTGLDPATDRIVQHGALVYCTTLRKVVDARTWLVWAKDFPAIAPGEKVHGWSLEALVRYGRHPEQALVELNQFVRHYNAQFVIAHNGIFYDKRMVQAEHERRVSPSEWHEFILELPWLDTCHHSEWNGAPSKNLLTLAAYNNFINPFPHDALTDCLTINKLLQLNPELVRQMAATAAKNYVLVFANVPPGFNEATNKKLKAKKFVWQELNGEFYAKCWIKRLPRDDFEDFAASCDFPVNIIKDLPAADEYVNLMHNLNAEKK